MIIIIHNHVVLLFIFIRFATLLHSCLASIKKGSKKASAKEITLASHAIGKILTKLRLFSYIMYVAVVNCTLNFIPLQVVWP